MNDAVKSRPVVSFCIPVYNNAEAAQKIVKGLLVSDDPRFEVVINDNASTDETHRRCFHRFMMNVSGITAMIRIWGRIGTGKRLWNTAEVRIYS